MKYRISLLIACVGALMALSTVSACAQRTMNRQFFVNADYLMTLHPGDETGVNGMEVFAGEYLRNFYWNIGFQLYPRLNRINLGCVNVAAGAMWRPFSTRDRMFSMYIGGNLIAGADFSGPHVINDIISGSSDDSSSEVSTESVNPSEVSTEPVNPTEEEGTEVPVEHKSSTQAVYGLSPRIEFEFFPLRKVAVVAGVEAPFKLRAQSSNFSLKGFVGLRVNF